MDILIGVKLPDDCTGTLVLEYWPKSLSLGLWVSLVAALLALVAGIFWYRKDA